MKFLVTGGAGFIGSHIVRRLVETDQTVRVLDDLSYGSLDNLTAVQDGNDFVKADVRDAERLAQAMSGVDCVVHLAAVASVQRSVDDPVATSLVNLLGSVNVLDQARRAGVKRVVFASSAAVYGQGPEPVKTEALALCPASPYAADKASVETMCRMFSGLYGLETVALRYFNIYGPRQNTESDYATVIPRFLGRMLGGERPVVFGDGLQTRDFCYVDDVVSATILAATCPAVGHGEAINIGSGTSTSVLDLVDHLNAALGTSLVPEHATPRAGDVRHSRADISLAARLLGYQPQIPLAEGLWRTAAWFRERWPSL
ncbi:MAG: NAD-dependent epimerase/dehydratase family protein [Bacillota bacterium]|nr:NAD-dependent epimerase/dehydratase family protein [Bacillota bacterium]